MEDFFRTLFESSPDAIFIEDPEGYVLDCNPAAAVLHRSARNQLVGKHVTDLVPPELRDKVIIAPDNCPSEFEGLSLTADGAAIPVESTRRVIQRLIAVRSEAAETPATQGARSEAGGLIPVKFPQAVPGASRRSAVEAQ